MKLEKPTHVELETILSIESKALRLIDCEVFTDFNLNRIFQNLMITVTGLDPARLSKEFIYRQRMFKGQQVILFMNELDSWALNFYEELIYKALSKIRHDIVNEITGMY